MEAWKNALLILVVAGCVVAAYLMSTGEQRTLTTTLPGMPSSGQDAQSALGSVAPLPPSRSPRGTVDRGIVAPIPSVHPVKSSLDTIRGLSFGREPRQINRRTLQEAIALAERNMTPEMVRQMAVAFRDTDDQGFRWAMSYLLQRIGANEFVAPLRDFFEEQPSRATEALQTIGTEDAIQALISLAPTTEDPEVRAKVDLAIARSNLENAERYLASVWENEALPARVRMGAASALAFRDPGRALPDALSLALGESQPLRGELGELAGSFTSTDLREAGVHAVMRLGDLASFERLLDAADARPNDRAFAAMVDFHMAGFAGVGPDVAETLMDRARTQGELTPGVGDYLGKVCCINDIPALQALKRLARTEAARTSIEAAMSYAERRPTR